MRLTKPSRTRLGLYRKARRRTRENFYAPPFTQTLRTYWPNAKRTTMSDFGNPFHESTVAALQEQATSLRAEPTQARERIAVLEGALQKLTTAHVHCHCHCVACAALSTPKTTSTRERKTICSSHEYLSIDGDCTRCADPTPEGDE